LLDAIVEAHRCMDKVSFQKVLKLEIYKVPKNTFQRSHDSVKDAAIKAKSMSSRF